MIGKAELSLKMNLLPLSAVDLTIVPNKVGLGSHVCNTGVMIDPTYRGRGFGKIMNDFAIRKARELGYMAIQLNLVVATNAASLHICKQNGFEIVGTLPGAFFYKRERYVDAYVLYKTLGGEENKNK